MKKLRIILFSVLFYQHFAFAQAQKMEVGISVAAGVSNGIYFGDNYAFAPNNHAQFAMAAGAIIQFNLTNVFSLVANPGFERKGFTSDYTSFEYPDYNPIFESTINEFNYITLPILARFSFGKKVKFFVNAGPYVGYLVAQNSEKTKAVVSGVQYTQNDNNYMETWSNIDFGVAAGFGIKIPLSKALNVSLEFRDHLGVAGLRENQSFTNSDTWLSNNVAYCQLGLTYGVGK